jgi:uncharacterized membrane protein
VAQSTAIGPRWLPGPRFSRWFWTLLLAGAGVAHLVLPNFFVAYYPAYLPWAQEAVVASAVVEWLLALGLWLPRWERVAWLAVAGLMLSYVPVHWYAITDHAHLAHPWPAVPLWLAWVRLPVQFGFIGWAWGRWWALGRPA